MGRRRRRRRGIRNEALIRSDWFLGIVLADRLPIGTVNANTLATCKMLGTRFVIECPTAIDEAVSAAIVMLDEADLDHLVNAVLPVLLPWARDVSGVEFTDRDHAPYR